MMRRREFITLLGGVAAAWPIAVRAQEKRRIPKVGVLWHAADAEEEGALFRALVEGFRALGYIDGQNIILEHRFPNEMPERFKSMAAELVSLNVDVLVSSGNNAAPYAKKATATIPVVAMFITDPVGIGLVKSLARPEGNVTGLSIFTSELIGTITVSQRSHPGPVTSCTAGQSACRNLALLHRTDPHSRSSTWTGS